MKRVTLMHLRHHLGSVLDEVRITAEPVVLERSGRAIAMLCPMDYLDRNGNDIDRRREALAGLCGQGRSSSRDKDLSSWLKKSRKMA